MTALGLRCCMPAFSSSGKPRLLSICCVRASHCSGFSCCRAQALECRLSSCGTWAQLPRGMWNLLSPGMGPVSPALAGGFLNTRPPGKSQSGSSEWTCTEVSCSWLCTPSHHSCPSLCALTGRQAFGRCVKTPIGGLLVSTPMYKRSWKMSLSSSQQEKAEQTESQQLLDPSEN